MTWQEGSWIGWGYNCTTLTWMTRRFLYYQRVTKGQKSSLIFFNFFGEPFQGFCTYSFVRHMHFLRNVSISCAFACSRWSIRAFSISYSSRASFICRWCCNFSELRGETEKFRRKGRIMVMMIAVNCWSQGGRKKKWKEHIKTVLFTINKLNKWKVT